MSYLSYNPTVTGMLLTIRNLLVMTSDAMSVNNCAAQGVSKEGQPPHGRSFANRPKKSAPSHVGTSPSPRDPSTRCQKVPLHQISGTGRLATTEPLFMWQHTDAELDITLERIFRHGEADLRDQADLEGQHSEMIVGDGAPGAHPPGDQLFSARWTRHSKQLKASRATFV